MNNRVVTCAIIELDDKILCVQRSKEMPLPMKWELPGGKLESEETPEECIAREIVEELGVQISIIYKLPIFHFRYSNEEPIQLLPFLCKIVRGTIILKEHIQAKWLYKNELLSLDWAEADIPIIQYYLKECTF
jgi:8-oxo-dGTP diphosphatase